MSKDPTKLVVVVTNYVFKSSFMTQNLHLKGEEVFGLAKHNVDYSPGANDDSHKLNHVNLFCPHVAIPPSQLNNVDNLHVH